MPYLQPRPIAPQSPEYQMLLARALRAARGDHSSPAVGPLARAADTAAPFPQPAAPAAPAAPAPTPVDQFAAQLLEVPIELWMQTPEPVRLGIVRLFAQLSGQSRPEPAVDGAADNAEQPTAEA